jgi:hypothetical protein
VGRGLLKLCGGLVIQQPERHTELVAGPGRVYTERTPGFTELSLLILHDERQVPITRRRQRQSLLKVDLPGRALQQVGAANDIADILRGVIDYDGKLVGKRAITALDNGIPKCSQLESTFTLNAVHP